MEADYLMFIDDDVLVSPTVLEVLLSRKKDITAAITFLRSYPFEPMFFKTLYSDELGIKVMDKYHNWEDNINSEGLVECDAVGFSCVLINVELLKKVSTPFFVTSPWHTEDTYFCIKAKNELGLKEVSVFVDTTVPTSHLVDKEGVNIGNVKSLRKYYEEAYPEITSKLKSSSRLDRNIESVENMLKVFA